ncbi:MAG: DUF5677 domain-containing protein [Longimicrobiaceae bacterium]
MVEPRGADLGHSSIAAQFTNDRAFAREYIRQEVLRIYGPVLDLFLEMLDECASFQTRAIISSKRELEDTVLAGVLYRRVQALFDSIVVQLSAGQIHGANLVLRAFLETAWAIEWMLKEDVALRARQYYVLRLRHQIAENAVFIRGTEEHKQFAKDLSDQRLTELGLPSNSEEIARNEMERVAAHIAKYPDLAHVDAEISRRKKRVSDLKWFELFGGPNNYGALARHLDRGDEYVVTYRNLSHAIHGSRTQDHVLVREPGKAEIQPIRELEGFAGVVQLAWALILRVHKLMVMHFRPDEFPSFQRRFFPEGKSRLNLPDVEFERDVAYY